MTTALGILGSISMCFIFRHHPVSPSLAVQQIAFADKILLNKLDLVSDEEKQAVIKRIRVRACLWEGGLEGFSGTGSMGSMSGSLARPQCPAVKPTSNLPHQGINKGVDIFECIQSAVAIDRLLGINAFSLDKLLAEDPAFLVNPERTNTQKSITKV